MSQITISENDARLSVIGYQPEVSRIYWSALPTALPVYGQTLDLSGAEITAVYADGSETVVTDYCTFTPDTGEAVPNADTLTITATYTARSGKACQADTTLPIVTLDHIKIIVPRTVPDYIKEQGAAGGENPTFTDYANAFGFGSVYVAAYWSRGGEIVRVTKLDTDSVLSSPNVYWGDWSHIASLVDPMPGPDLFLARYSGGSSASYDRYYTPTEHEEVSYSQVFTLNASYEFAGDTYTDTAYLSADYLVGERLADPPLEYTDSETLTLRIQDPDDIALEYTHSGQQPLSAMYPYLSATKDYIYPGWLIAYPYGSVEPAGPSAHGALNASCWSALLTFTNNASGWLRFIDHRLSGSGLYRPNTIIKFTCSDGAISWEYED